MNKATVAKLEKLNKRFHKHEEAIEENFSAKQVAIVRYRIGAEDNALHELKDVAAHFKCSVSYVTKVIRDITDFCIEMDKKYPKTPKKGQTKQKEDGVKVAVMSAKIVDGKVTVQHSDPELAKQVEHDLQEMVDTTMRGEGCGECPACVHNTRMELGQKAMKLQSKATNRAFWAFMALIFALVLAVVVTVKTSELTAGQAAAGYGLVAVVALFGLISYISGVSLIGKRNGLLEAARNI